MGKIKTDQMLTFAWDDDARMFLPNSTFGGSRIDRKHRDDTEQSGLVLTLTTCCRANIIVPAADRGQRTAFNVLAKRPEFPASLKGSSKRFWAHIEVLRQLRRIEEYEYRRTDRHYAAALRPISD